MCWVDGPVDFRSLPWEAPCKETSRAFHLPNSEWEGTDSTVAAWVGCGCGCGRGFLVSTHFSESLWTLPKEKAICSGWKSGEEKKKGGVVRVWEEAKQKFLYWKQMSHINYTVRRAQNEASLSCSETILFSQVPPWTSWAVYLLFFSSVFICPQYARPWICKGGVGEKRRLLPDFPGAHGLVNKSVREQSSCWCLADHVSEVRSRWVRWWLWRRRRRLESTSALCQHSTSGFAGSGVIFQSLWFPSRGGFLQRTLHICFPGLSSL